MFHLNIMDILKKIKQAELVGRGGACFPVEAKWKAVKEAKEKEKYVVCNASEGEPGVKKDGYILENYPDRVVEGMRLARQFLESGRTKVRVKSYIYINPSYFEKYEEDLREVMEEEDDIEFFIKPESSGYIGGEETSLLNIMEEKRAEPRLRPPFPTTEGLWGRPTIVNNVETFYDVSLVYRGEYKKERFYTVGGKCKKGGVYRFPERATIEKILKQTGNYPDFPFFVQIGGDASGEVLNSGQLKRGVTKAGSITVYKLNTPPQKMIKRWLQFFLNQSCGQCTPCREGVYRLVEIIKAEKVNWHLFEELLEDLQETPFCGLGCAVPIPILSYVRNVVSQFDEKEINISKKEKTRICECFDKQ